MFIYHKIQLLLLIVPLRRQGRFILANYMIMARASSLVSGYGWASGPVGLQIQRYNKSRITDPRQKKIE